MKIETVFSACANGGAHDQGKAAKAIDAKFDLRTPLLLVI
jgi:hypothetical protein